MICYASRTGTRRNLAALRAAGWRIMVSARGCLRSEGFAYALDNGAWTAHTHDEPFDSAAFLRAVAALGAGADFVVAPDIVCGGPESLDLSLSWLDGLLAVTRRVLIPVQNGMTPDDLRPHLSDRVGLFVGGDDAWKESSCAMWGRLAREVGCWLHVGRVNTARRIAICAAAGADSIDGSSVSRFAVTLPRLDNARRQTSMVV